MLLWRQEVNEGSVLVTTMYFRDYTTIAIIVAFLVVFLITLTIPVIRTIQKRRHKVVRFIRFCFNC